MGIKSDEFYMQLALEQASYAENIDEVPVGAILVLNDKIIAKSYNQQITKNDPSAHAEIEVLRIAGKKQNNYRLLDSTLFCTLEPCAMCFGAIIHARIKRVVFAANDYKTGVCGSCIDLAKTNCFNHKLLITAGVLQGKSQKILQDFFHKKRKAKSHIKK